MSQPTSEETQRQIQEIAAVRAQTRNWRLGMVIGLLGIVLTCVLTIVNGVRALAEPGPTQEILMTEFKSGMDTQVIDPVKRLAQKAASDLQRDLKKELDKATQRTPEIVDAFNKELTTLQTSLPNRGKNVLERTFGAEFKRREKKLQEMFPGINEDKIGTLVENVISESEASMEHLSHVLFAQHTKALNDIFTHIETIQKSEKFDPNDEATSWEIFLSAFDVLREELRVFEKEDGPPEGQPKAGAKSGKNNSKKQEAK